MRLNKTQSYYSEQQLRAYLTACRFPGFEGTPASDLALPEPSLKTLSLLMIHHLTTFPFESTSIHYESNHSVSIDLDDIYNRFVIHKYGGYCMQANILFRHMLLKLGFHAFTVSGRVCGSTSPNPPASAWTGPTHFTTVVQLPCHLDDHKPQRNALYLTDVGFGARCLLRPILLRDGHKEMGRANLEHRIIKAPVAMSSFDPLASDQEHLIPPEILESQYLWYLQYRYGPDQEWRSNYSLTMTEAIPADFQVANEFTSTYPGTFFVDSIVIVSYDLELEEGWEKVARERCQKDGLCPDLYPYHPSQIGENVLFGTKLSRRSATGGTSDVVLQTEAQRVEAIQSVFGLLKGLSVEEALKNMKGRQAEIQQV